MGDPVVVESWHLPRALSDEALRLLTTLPMEELERRLRVPDLLHRAADLLERQELRPIPVSERPWERQGWCNKDGRCWFGWADEPDASWSFCKPSERDTATVSLAAHALPLPEVEVQ